MTSFLWDEPIEPIGVDELSKLTQIFGSLNYL